ncbi:dipeptide epimerase [Duganella sp. BJB488]|uniref:enolase C-terminal domain-like protein n=1 Tax=unclassified Duganella TaxID=2636909 RepID=UPI000E354041|nr:MULTISPECIES: enolase C-terminal domain-like protein [unclassified Duganella]RFP17870.1 dipeptide epimerase [Duganella sp. BJB489]RFP17955.1 dipeptide epimerase [Duganella sp. BJB488]RFP37710.1 dipeptide epimerase [Duganella sp. BJB480]
MLISTFVEEVVFKQPLSIAGRTLVGQQVLRISARHRGWVAEAEAAGVFYRGESGATMQRQVHEWLADPPGDLPGMWSRVQQMPPGGARNALDWIVWQLEAAQRGIPAYSLAHLPGLRARTTMVTLGVAAAGHMAAMALNYPFARALKLKLDGSAEDAERVTAVRRARPDVGLSVDANEGWTIAHLDRMMGTLLEHRVELIEQPLPANSDAALDHFSSPIRLAADESLQTQDELEQVAQRYQVANIKLDKCGGLTAALTLAASARQLGLEVMVGCMGGRSMALLPAFIAAQAADLVDLDAPLLMANDSAPSASYVGGRIDFDPAAYAQPVPSSASVSASSVQARHAGG